MNARTEEVIQLLRVRAGVIADAIAEVGQCDCLPLPDLTPPATVSEVAGALEVVGTNLFDRNGHRTDAWVQARRCDVLGAERVYDVNELVYRWYGLLCSAAGEVVPGRTAVVPMEHRVELFDRFMSLRKVTS